LVEVKLKTYWKRRFIFAKGAGNASKGICFVKFPVPKYGMMKKNGTESFIEMYALGYSFGKTCIAM